MTENMEADPFNISLRKFLKQVGVTSQRAVEEMVEKQGLKGRGRLTLRAVITAEGTDLNHVVEGDPRSGLLGAHGVTVHGGRVDEREVRLLHLEGAGKRRR